jgi:hypothetical protein
LLFFIAQPHIGDLFSCHLVEVHPCECWQEPVHNSEPPHRWIC